jgi:hypothetical protein
MSNIQIIFYKNADHFFKIWSFYVVITNIFIWLSIMILMKSQNLMYCSVLQFAVFQAFLSKIINLFRHAQRNCVKSGSKHCINLIYTNVFIGVWTATDVPKANQNVLIRKVCLYRYNKRSKILLPFKAYSTKRALYCVTFAEEQIVLILPWGVWT